MAFTLHPSPGSRRSASALVRVADTSVAAVAVARAVGRLAVHRSRRAGPDPPRGPVTGDERAGDEPAGVDQSARVDDLARAERRALEPGRGRQVHRPGELPLRGWADILKRVAAEAKADNVPLLAGGVAYYALISLVPAMVAVVAIYGLVADPADVADNLRSLSTALPAQAGDLLVEQVTRIAGSSTQALGLSALVGVATALWGASSGMRWMMSALSLAYDEPETRGFVRLRGGALILTAGATLSVVVTVGLITAVPALAGAVGLEDTGTAIMQVLRWPVMGALTVVGLSVLYRYGPDRSPARWRWVTVGSLAATLMWLAASAGFAFYASVAGSFDETYGPLGGVVVLMLWLYLSVLAVLLGAELNAEMEHQTAQDTTTGPGRPLGRRGAAMADDVGVSRDEVSP